MSKRALNPNAPEFIHTTLSNKYTIDEVVTSINYVQYLINNIKYKVSTMKNNGTIDAKIYTNLPEIAVATVTTPNTISNNDVTDEKYTLLKDICETNNITFNEELYKKYNVWDASTNNKGKNRFQKMCTFLKI